MALLARRRVRCLVMDSAGPGQKVAVVVALVCRFLFLFMLCVCACVVVLLCCE